MNSLFHLVVDLFSFKSNREVMINLDAPSPVFIEYSQKAVPFQASPDFVELTPQSCRITLLLSNQFLPNRLHRELARLLLHRNTPLNEQQNASKAQLLATQSCAGSNPQAQHFLTSRLGFPPSPLASPPFITWKGI